MLRAEAATLARRLMNEHGLTNWTFQYDRAKRRFGMCDHRRKTINLSSHLVALNTVEEVTDVILHEIAHALVGPGHKHDAVWKLKCVEVGARPERCYDSKEVNTPGYRWIGMCPNCGHTLGRHRLKEGTKQLACNRCCKRYSRGKWDSQFLFEWMEITPTHHPELEFVDSLPEG